jgi:Raf kinase inhibitor-like YbhB/YbcL family protein
MLKSYLSRVAAPFVAALVFLVAVADAQPGRGPMMMVQSSAFPDGGVVPEKYAARGDNVQPDFSFTNVPANAVALAVIFHDIDVAIGGTNDVLHWMAWNIPTSGGSLALPEGSLPAGSVQGNNIRQQPGYMGPGAPVGERFHHYVFEFYALSANLDLPASASREDLLAAMAGAGVVVGKAAYVGRYRGSE